MENTDNTKLSAQGVEFWEKELQYLEEAMRGLATAYAILESNHKYCSEMLHKVQEDNNGSID